MRRLLALAAIGCCLSVIAPRHTAAQAWTPFKGEGTFAFSFQRVKADGHFLEDGSKLPGYSTEARNLILELTYAFTDDVVVNFTVPFVNVRYLGPEEPFNLPANTLDDGTYHGSITDLGFQFRYNVLEDPVAITPFFSAGVPSHGYETLGESAPGRNFQEYRLGSYVGRFLDPFLPRAFLHGYYSYSWVRQDLGIPLNYSSLGFEAGYFVGSSFSASFLLRQHWTHGGLSFNELFEAPPEVFVNLDRVVRVSYTHIGASVGYSVNDSVSLFGNYVRFLDGIDAHYGGGFSFGVSWMFKHREQEILFPFEPDENDTSVLQGVH